MAIASTPRPATPVAFGCLWARVCYLEENGGGGGAWELVAAPLTSADPGAVGQYAVNGDGLYLYVGAPVNEWRFFTGVAF